MCTKQPFSSTLRSITKHFSRFKITTCHPKSTLLPVDGFSSVAIGENSEETFENVREKRKTEEMWTTREHKFDFNLCEAARDHTTTNQEPEINRNFPPELERQKNNQ